MQYCIFKILCKLSHRIPFLNYQSLLAGTSSQYEATLDACILVFAERDMLVRQRNLYHWQVDIGKESS